MILLPQTFVIDIRRTFIRLLRQGLFTENKNKTGSKTVEIINATFIADEPAIFGTVNTDWVERESQWYHSQSLNVNDIPGGPPKIWSMVATPDGFINSNYGWCLFSPDNYSQFLSCAQQLKDDEFSRRAIMIYTRPSMQVEYNKGGMSDYICTNTVQYFIRNNQLFSCVSMRSSDAIFGYKGDWQWQQEIQSLLLKELLGDYPNLKIGPIIWNAGSLHVYSRHFQLIEDHLDQLQSNIYYKNIK
jgi:thymidylate synthase